MEAGRGEREKGRKCKFKVAIFEPKMTVWRSALSTFITVPTVIHLNSLSL